MNNKKLNNDRARAGKKGGIFKRIADRPTKQELQSLTDYYKKLTAAVSDDFAMEMLDSPEAWHYLRLLKIADFRKMGKSFAIVTAWKMGYMAGKDSLEHGLTEPQRQYMKIILEDVKKDNQKGGVKA